MKKFFLFLCLIFLAFNVNESFCQVTWERLEGPYGGSINSITKGFGDDIIAIASTVYKSSDRCKTWKAVENKTFRPIDLHFHNGLVYGISSSVNDRNCIYVSNDSMKTWSLKNSGLENQQTRTIVFRNDDIYALTDSGAYLSTNGGGNWIRCFYIKSMVRNMIYDLKFNSKGMMFLATVAGLYRSKDNGATWELMNPGEQKMKGNIENIILDQDEKIFLNTPDAMFRSNNDGDTWEQVGAGIINGNISFIYSPDIGTLYIGKFWGGIFKSTDFGDTWKSISQTGIRTLLITNDDKFLTTSENGVMMADSLTGKWELSNNGISETTVTALYLDKTGARKDEILAGSMSGMIYKSSDAGQSWKQVHEMQGSWVTAFVKGKGGLILSSSIWGGIDRSNDYGDTWASCSAGIGDPDIKAMAIDNNGNLYAGSFSVMYKSTNNGDSWTQCFWQDESVQSTSIAISSKNEIYLGTLRYGIIKSTNSFINCTQISSLMYSINYLAINKADEIFAVTVQGDLYKSTNGGTTWTLLGSNTGIRAMYFLGNNDILASVDQNHEVVGMLRSRDGGKTWVPEKTGMGSQFVYSLESNTEGAIYAGSGNGIYRTGPAVVTVEDGNSGQYTYADLAVYPNPTVGDAKVHLKITEGCIASIEIFSLAGSMVRTVAQGFYEQGDYYIPLETTGLAAGIYYLKCTAGGRNHTLLLTVQ